MTIQDFIIIPFFLRSRQYKGTDPHPTPVNPILITTCYHLPMSRHLRDFKPNSYYHVFNRGNNKEAILKSPADKQLFLGLIFRYKKDCNINIVAYCIMDNHFHLIIKTPTDTESLSRYMQKLTGTFAMEINRKYQRVGHAFQGRYNANYLPYKKDLLRTRAYLRQNPVRDGLVRKAGDYKWLSKG